MLEFILAAATVLQPPAITHGPILGRVTTTDALVWARAADDSELTLSVQREDQVGAPQITVRATPSEEHDRCVVFRVDGLSPGARYRYTLNTPGEPGGSISTPKPDGDPARVTLAIGSCADEKPETARCYQRIAEAKADALVLIGDTPYIDSTDLAVQRRRYREFAAVPEFAALVRCVPLYSTWDDHDFGKNDTDGLMKGKEQSRQAFLEYHPGAPEYGEGGRGVYCSFRNGPVEVFLLDTRWFAGTEPSPADPDQRTLLGSQQWNWLATRLKASDAPFKLLVSGMIWNDAVRPGKTDYWGHYPHEREALFKFIGDNGISGCVLVGGDIHRSRVVRHLSQDTAGYRLVELITSPMHGSLIALANAPHPGLVKDMGEVHSFLLLTADNTVTPPTLEARFSNNEGKDLFQMTITADDCRAPARPGPSR